MAELIWRKSSHSEKLECVEVALLPDRTLVRDSKNPGHGHLVLTTHQWHAFLARFAGQR